MSALKANIKSKKDKMNVKKQLKEKVIPVVEVIESDDQIKIPTIQQVSNILLSKKQKIEFLPNNFNLQKLKKLQFSFVKQKEDNHQDQLKVQLVQDFNLNSNPQIGRKLFIYKTQGSNVVRYTSSNSVKQKFNQQIKDKLAVEQNSQQQNQQKKIKKHFRYFTNKKDSDQQSQGQMVTCYRCKQQGHVAKNCSEEAQKQKCNFCLGMHPTNECNSTLCFKCGENDHVAEQCKNKGARCKKCGKSGHTEKNCGVVLFLDYSNKSYKDVEEMYDVNDMRKLKCLAKCRESNGHFNCQKYLNKGPMPYQRSFKSPTKKPLRNKS